MGRNVWTQDNSPQNNSPHIKRTLKQFAPGSETNSPHVVILHNVLKHAGKIINISKFYSPQLDINFADRFLHTSDYLFPGDYRVTDEALLADYLFLGDYRVTDEALLADYLFPGDYRVTDEALLAETT